MLKAPSFDLDEVSKGLLKAASLIEQYGWWDGSYPRQHNKLCAALALNRAFESNSSSRIGFSRLAEQAGIKSIDNITGWNDKNDAETVIRTLREAAYNQGNEQ